MGTIDDTAADDTAPDELDRLLDAGLDDVYRPRPSAPGVAAGAADGAEARCGRYRLVEMLARGGVGVVWRGRDEHLGRDVAVKVLDERHAGRPDVLARFLEEAQIASQLQHPGTVPVYEAGVDDRNRPWFAMKLVRGRTLARSLADRASPEERRAEILAVFERICQTIAYAHDRGVVHRDLKPSNVMVGSFGEVQVFDWGLAKVIRDAPPAAARADADPAPADRVTTVRSTDDSSQSLAGSVVGTPAYMPPEQARGTPEDVDERADVFSLGAILAEILTGRPPYDGSDRDDLLRRAAGADLADVAARLDACGADPDLVALARRCLRAEPEARPRTAGAVAAAMAAHLATVEDRARAAQLDAAEARGKAAEERKALRLGLALAAVVLVALAGGGWLWWKAEAKRRDEMHRTGLFVQEAAAEAEKLAARGAWDAAGEALRNARRAVAMGPADPASVSRLDATEAGIGAKREQARLQAERESASRALLDAIEEVRARQVDGPEDADEAYSQVFSDHGLPLETWDPERTGRLVRELDPDVRAQLALALDDWAANRRARNPDRGRRGPGPPGPPGGAGAEPARPGPGPGGFPDAAWKSLVRVAQALDPDPARRELREAVLRDDTAFLRARADDLDAAGLAPVSLRHLASSLRHAGDGARALGVLRAGYLAHPGEFWINNDLALALCGGIVPGRFGIEVAAPDTPDMEEALRHAWIAASVASGSALAWEHLATILLAAGRGDEALRCARRAETLAPERRVIGWVVCRALVAAGDAAAARARLRDLTADDRDSGRTLGDLVAAVLGPLPPAARLARLVAWDDGTGTEPRILGEIALAHFQAGDQEAVVATCDRWLKSGGRAPGIRPTLAAALAALGRYDEAIEVLDAVSERDASGSRLLRADVERLRRVDRRRRDGTVAQPPAAPAERVLLARVHLARDACAAAARLLLDAAPEPAEEVDPPPLPGPPAAPGAPGAGPSDPPPDAGPPGRPRRREPGRGPRGARPDFAPAQLRSATRDAVAALVRAGCGLGRDAAGAGEPEKAAFRARALALFREARAPAPPGGRRPDERDAPALASADVRRVLETWRFDPRLAPVRDPAALSALPASERAAWLEAWSGFEARLRGR